MEPRNQADSPTAWNIPLIFGKVHDPEEDHFHHGKKFSVIAKVKEKARKWQQSLVRKRHADDGNKTPSWGVALEDYEEEGLEHLGASMYGSEQASETCYKIAGKQARADQMISENHVLCSTVNSHSDDQEQEKYYTVKYTSESKSNSDDRETLQAKGFDDHQREEAPTTTETLMAQRSVDQLKEKLPCPLMTTETAFAEEKEEDLSNEETTTQNAINEIEEEEPDIAQEMTETKSTEEEQEKKPPTLRTIKAAMSEKLAPAYATVYEATHKFTSKIQDASFREYIRSKLEPGENEKALSQIISELIHPRGTPGEKNILKKIREALTLLLQAEEPSPPSSTKSVDPSYQIPVSTNAYEVGEEHQGRILQAN